MRPAYFLVKVALSYALRLYHRRTVFVNGHKVWKTRTIFASNHPSAFMDPLVIAVRQNPIVHFMTRADIYKGIVKFIFWNVHMIPVFRSHDGSDSHKKNEESFRMAYDGLRNGRGIIMFAEGFTDDRFIRRLKPIKKGSVRMGFGACEEMNWKEKVYIQAVGLNYTHAAKFDSELLISYGPHICLNDYKDQYEENPNKVVTDLTRELEGMMREQITHVEHKEWAHYLHEGIMRLTRKGMNHENSDFSIPLEERWKYSRKLALWLNEQNVEDEELNSLRDDLKEYFADQRKSQLEENWVYEYTKKGKVSVLKDFLFILFGFPLALLGFIHGAPAYFGIKPLVEKMFKRHVFWSGVKMVGSMLAAGLYNMLFIFLFYYLIYPSWWMAIAYYFVVPGAAFVVFYRWMTTLRKLKWKLSATKRKLDRYEEWRSELLERIAKRIPVA
jgi:hypothetical protein